MAFLAVKLVVDFQMDLENLAIPDLTGRQEEIVANMVADKVMSAVENVNIKGTFGVRVDDYGVEL